jgi:hypothetical protein
MAGTIKDGALHTCVISVPPITHLGEGTNDVTYHHLSGVAASVQGPEDRVKMNLCNIYQNQQVLRYIWVIKSSYLHC